MNTVAETIIAQAHRFSSKLGSVTPIIDKLADRLIPHNVARACGGNVLCNYYCSYDPYCLQHYGKDYMIANYADTYQGCASAPFCDVGCAC